MRVTLKISPAGDLATIEVQLTNEEIQQVSAGQPVVAQVDLANFAEEAPDGAVRVAVTAAG